MPLILDSSKYFVNESAGFGRAGNTYDLFAVIGEKPEKAGTVIEHIPGFFKKILKFTPLKTLLGFDIKFFDNDMQLSLRLHRRFTFFLSNIDIYNEKDERIGMFKQVPRLIIARFNILDSQKKIIAILKGDWRDWKFKISRPDKTVVSFVNKKWAGLRKELFTTADKYQIDFKDTINNEEKLLTIASAIIIDMVLKEYS
jgi:hypothetical protein